MKVHIVDDNQAHRHLCRLLLNESSGDQFEFEELATGALGLEACRTRPPDCVLLDYKLPDMTGQEFLERLLADDPSGRPSVAVVMLTSLTDEQAAVQAMKTGAQDYLIKDRITPESLRSAIDKAIEKVGLVRALEQERDRLAQSVVEKEILLKEVHHRVKNNLQVIASLLRMQARGVSTVGDALRASQNRVESMALIHEQLYETEDMKEVDVAKNTAMLVTNLCNSYGVDPRRIAFEISIDRLSLGVDRAIPVGLILNELISNALKHAFPNSRRGKIRVDGGIFEKRITISVHDDGAGLDQDFDLDNSKSMGLEIVRVLTRQLKGVFESDRANGTTFRISFPEMKADASAA